MPIHPKPATPPERIRHKNAVAYAAHALNVAVREAAEADLEITVTPYVQDLKGNHLSRAENAPAVDVTVERYADKEQAPP